MALSPLLLGLRVGRVDGPQLPDPGPPVRQAAPSLVPLGLLLLLNSSVYRRRVFGGHATSNYIIRLPSEGVCKLGEAQLCSVKNISQS